MAIKTLRDLINGIAVSASDLFISRQGADTTDKSVTAGQIKDFVLADSATIKSSYESNPDTNAFTDAEQAKLAGIENGADVTDSVNVDASGAVMEYDYNANTILKADLDNIPQPLVVPNSTFVGRNLGNIEALDIPTAQQMLSIQFTEQYISPTTAIIAGGAYQFPHGLSQTPKLVFAKLINVTAQGGYRHEDEVFFFVEHQGGSRGMSVIADTINIRVRLGRRDRPLLLVHFNNGGTITTIPNRWQFQIHAYT